MGGLRFYRERIFPLLAGALWGVFLFLDLTRVGDSTWIKFAGICLCFLSSLTGLSTLEDMLVTFALAFTVAADWFLLVRDDHYTLGISLFIMAQLLYACRLYRLRGKGPWGWGLALRLLALAPSLFLLLSVVLSQRGASSPVLVPFALLLYAAPGSLTVFPALSYFVNLCVNTAEAFTLGRSGRRFALGLLLFVCCDICVGAWNTGLLPGFTRVGMWLFYLPSQVLIVLSQEQGKGNADEKTV